MDGLEALMFDPEWVSWGDAVDCDDLRTLLDQTANDGNTI